MDNLQKTGIGYEKLFSWNRGSQKQKVVDTHDH